MKTASIKYFALIAPLMLAAVLLLSLFMPIPAQAVRFEYGPGATMGNATDSSNAPSTPDPSGSADSSDASGSPGATSTPGAPSQEPVDGDEAKPDANGALAISLDDMTTQDANTYSSDRNSTSVAWGSAGDYSQVYVFDLAHLFTTSQYESLCETAQQLADTYQMGVYLLTTDYMNGLANPTSSQRTSYASGFYKQFNLGVGASHDGIMLVIAADSRDYVTIAYGQGSYSFDDEGIEKMEDDVTDYLGDNEWYKGAQAYYHQIGAQLAYYAKHGRPGSPLTAGDWAFRIILIVVIPFAIALCIVLSERRAMKPVRQRDEATEYLDPNSLIVTAANDTFITTNLIVTARASSSGGGSHGGGWGGGGGGGFSSSGGGKF